MDLQQFDFVSIDYVR